MGCVCVGSSEGVRERRKAHRKERERLRLRKRGRKKHKWMEEEVHIIPLRIHEDISVL